MENEIAAEVRGRWLQADPGRRETMFAFGAIDDAYEHMKGTPDGLRVQLALMALLAEREIIDGDNALKVLAGIERGDALDGYETCPPEVRRDREDRMRRLNAELVATLNDMGTEEAFSIIAAL